jgi:hypothetical protein
MWVQGRRRAQNPATPSFRSIPTDAREKRSCVCSASEAIPEVAEDWQVTADFRTNQTRPNDRRTCAKALTRQDLPVERPTRFRTIANLKLQKPSASSDIHSAAGRPGD